jgi:peptidoglycan/xylan/chitin deacetylase (PgdA/CDA1 family)
MTLAQLKELAAHPLVTIGAHSHGHELLDQLSIDAARTSVTRSRRLLQGWTQQPVHHFAYPNGNSTPALMARLEEDGFASATILQDCLMRTDAPALALPRIGVGRYDSFARFKLRLVEV